MNSIVHILHTLMHPRIEYAARMLFERFGWEVQWHTEVDSWNVQKYKIAYGFQIPKVQCVHIPHFPSVYQTDLHEIYPYPVGKGRHCILFPIQGGDFQFDVFAATWYVLARVEEYRKDAKTDKLGRYDYTCSLQHKQDCLQLPIVDYWALHCLEMMKKVFPDIPHKLPKYQWIRTWDIDMAWKYLHKPMHIQLGGGIRNMLNGNWKEITQQFKVLSEKEVDPWDIHTSPQIQSILQNFPPHKIFWLLGKRNAWNKNAPPTLPAFQAYFNRIPSTVQHGIHPGVYPREQQANSLSEEIQQFQKWNSGGVLISRQHYLAFRLPTTYRLLIKSGVQEEYSMMYHNQIGFRAGTAHPFLWYDVEQDKITDLWIHPAQVMDVTLRVHLKLSQKQAAEKIQQLVQEIKNVGGQYISIWHNSSIHGRDEWEGWNECYTNG